MSDIVVDSSVAVKWILQEPDSALAKRLANEAVAAGDRLVLLDLALSEGANAIWKHYRQRRIDADEARVALADLMAIPVQIEPATRRLHAAREIAMKYDRAIYDALFIATANDLNVPGVTADEPLVKALGGAYPQIVLLRNWP